MRLDVATLLGLVLLLFAPTVVLGVRITIPCAQKVSDPTLSDSLEEIFDVLTENPLSASTQEISATPVDEQPLPSTEQSHKLNSYLASMEHWRERVEGALYSDGEPRPHIWFYPASGYDLATAVWMTNPKTLQANTSVFVLVDQQVPFLTVEKPGPLPSAIEFSAENLSVNADSSWAYSVAHHAKLRTRAQSLGGLLPATLSRMRAYYGTTFHIEKIFAIRDKAFLPPEQIYPVGNALSSLSQVSHPTHGVIAFRIGNSPIHYAIFVHGSVSSHSGKLVIGPWGAREIPLSLKIFGMLDGIVVKGSQGVLAPAPQNPSRDLLLSQLAKNRGIVYEGNHQNPMPKYRSYEPDPEPEVTTEFGFIRGFAQPAIESLTTSLGTYSTSRLEDWQYKWSYYEGARATRFR